MATGLCNSIGAKRHAVRPLRNAELIKISVTAKHPLEKFRSLLSSLGGFPNHACLSVESVKWVVTPPWAGEEQQGKMRRPQQDSLES